MQRDLVRSQHEPSSDQNPEHGCGDLLGSRLVIGLIGPGDLCPRAAIASLRRREGQSTKKAKNAIERLDDKLSNVWLFAGSWACDVERLHHVVLQESVKPLSGILLARVKMQAGLVMLLGELDGLLGTSAQAGSNGK